MITRLAIAGFRGITYEKVFEPEVLTVLTGRNGFGKTTFFDAIDWCLFGEASRFGSDASLVANLYAKTDGPRVALQIDLRGRSLTVVRTASDVQIDGTVVEERELAETLIVDPDVFPPYLRDLGRHVRSVSYLPQEQIREFVSASVTSDRRALLRGLLGVPNAGLVESSLKRIRDHFTTREKRLLEAIAELSSEPTDFAVVEFDQEADADAERFIAGTEGRFVGSDLSAIRRSIETLLAGAENDTAALDALHVATADLESVVAHANAELGIIERQRTSLAEQASAALTAVTDGQAALARALTAQQEALAHVASTSRRAAELESRFADQQRLAALRKDLVLADEVLSQAEQGLKLASEAAGSAATQWSDAQRAFDDRKREATVRAERSAKETERAAIQRRLTEIIRDAEETTAENSRLEAAAVASDAALQNALTTRDELVSTQRTLAVAAEREAQVAALREQLIALLPSDGSQCPLCGASYASQEEFLAHLQAAAPPHAQSQLQSVTTALNEAQTVVTSAQVAADSDRAAATRTRRRLEEIQRERADVEATIASIDASLDVMPSVSEATDLEEAAQLIHDMRALAAQAETTAAEHRDRVRDAQVRRQTIAAEQQLLASRSEQEPVTSQHIDEARLAVRAAEARSAKRADELQDLRATHAVSESMLADIRSQIDATEARAKAEVTRRERAIEECRVGCERLGVTFTSELPRLRTQLLERITTARQQIGRDREALARATAIDRRQQNNRSLLKDQDKRKQLVESEESLDALRRAQSRFEAVASSLEARARHEADAAGVQHRTAIQECINALYPHRHMNEINLDFVNGDLLVKDRWLTEGVRPEDYSSTGQSNVLALSVFLGLALRQTFAQNRFVMLDEPVQNLDDLHFLAFLTLIKRIALSRQVIVSTADSNIAEVLRRQLRSWSAGSRRWCEYEWIGFDPMQGPSVSRREGQKTAAA